MEKYKLVMFGFGIYLNNLNEVYKRLLQIPIARAKVEGIDNCYLIDLNSGEKFDINFNDKRYFIIGIDSEQNIF